MRLVLLITFLIAGRFISMSQTNEPSKKSPAEIMRGMRLKQLTTPPGEFDDRKPTSEFPQVRAVLMDWPLGPQIVTVVARSTGDASIYTTATFGVLGGIGHENVRNAAKSCVKVADKHFQNATPTQEYLYPAPGHVRFYLVGYDGVRVIDKDEQLLRTGKDNCSDLYQASQQVITELRSITQTQKGER